jgi:hypothetical protein
MVWDLTTMTKRNSDQTAKSLAEKQLPLVIASERELGFMPPFPFPNLGVEGCAQIDATSSMERIHTYLMDETGLGVAGNKPALTPRQLLARLRLLVADGPIAVALEGAGPDQVPVAVWSCR